MQIVRFKTEANTSYGVLPLRAKGFDTFCPLGPCIATDLDRLMEDRFIIGGPDQCVRMIRRFVEEYGMTHLICRTFFPGMPHQHMMRELELIAREVAPAFA